MKDTSDATETKVDCYEFVVDETPHCIWSFDLRRESVGFLRQIDPRYFSHVVDTNEPLLAGEESRIYAATSIRLVYFQALETLFGLLCATVQAPHCVLGWMLKYRNDELRNVVEKINQGRLALSITSSELRGWQDVATIIFNPEENGPAATMAVEGFGRFWRRLADDLLSENVGREYNNLKHGLRAGQGGFTLAIGREAAPGEAATTMRTLGGSDFGSRIYADKPFGAKPHFQLRRTMFNWNPVDVANATRLVVASIQNVLAYLTTKYGTKDGVGDGTVTMTVPDARSFASPWEDPPGVMTYDIGEGLDPDRVRLPSRDEVLGSVRVRVAEARATARPPAGVSA